MGSDKVDLSLVADKSAIHCPSQPSFRQYADFLRHRSNLVYQPRGRSEGSLQFLRPQKLSLCVSCSVGSNTKYSNRRLSQLIWRRHWRIWEGRTLQILGPRCWWSNRTILPIWYNLCLSPSIQTRTRCFHYSAQDKPQSQSSWYH